MGFSTPLNIPSDLGNEIESTNKENRRRLKEGKPPLASLIEVFAVQQEEAENGEQPKEPVMDGWELISIDANGINLKLDFTNPVAISGDDEPDLLLIQLDLSSFEDENGNKLPTFNILYLFQ